MVTIANSFSGQEQQFEVEEGKTCKQFIKDTGMIEGDAFSVRDKDGSVIDQNPIKEYDNQVITIGPPGEKTKGGF